MDINTFLQAVYITGIISSLTGVILEHVLRRTPPTADCGSLSYVGILLSLVPVVNIVLAVSVWSSILLTECNNNDDNHPPGCAC